MKVRWLYVALLVALLLGTVALPAAQAQGSGYQVPVTGEVPSFVGGGFFIGTMFITSFDWQGSTVLVKGLLNGEIREGDRSTIGNIRREVALRVAYVQGGCAGVRLVLEPFAPEEFPNVILLDPITLGAGLPAGAGNRLGNLLCAVGRVAEHNAPAGGLANLLNQVLRALS